MAPLCHFAVCLRDAALLIKTYSFVEILCTEIRDSYINFNALSLNPYKILITSHRPAILNVMFSVFNKQQWRNVTSRQFPFPKNNIPVWSTLYAVR